VNELESDFAVVVRALRVADQQATAYAVLNDRYKLRARLLDISILLLSVWLVAMTFVEPRIGDSLSPPFMRRELWIGLLSVGTFMLSAVQLLVDWKGRAASYSRSLAAVSGFVKTYRSLGKASQPQAGPIQQALAAYQAMTDSIESVPEAEFLKLKRRHHLKLAVSAMLDERPGMSIWLAYALIVGRDNFGSKVRRTELTGTGKGN
jgi:hypothetical protein